MKGNCLREGGRKAAIPLLPWPIPWKTTLNILPSLIVQKFFRDGSSYSCPVYNLGCKRLGRRCLGCRWLGRMQVCSFSVCC